MGTKIPREIRLEVMRKWLEGKSRDLIAYQVNIGAGTVSGIIKEFKRGDFNADLLREVALQLKKRGMDIRSFAPLVRLRHVLEEMKWISDVRLGQGEENGVKEEYVGDSSCNYDYDNEIDQFVEKKMESLIMSLEVLCYKKNLSVKQFFDRIHSIYLAAEKLGVPLEDIPDYIKQQETHIKNLSEWTKHWKSEEKAAFERYQTTQELLEEFELWRPTFDSNQQLKRKLEQVTKERDKYKFELESERFFWNKQREQRRLSTSQYELVKTNIDLAIEQARLESK
jgi:hypothetical protein